MSCMHPIAPQHSQHSNLSVAALLKGASFQTLRKTIHTGCARILLHSASGEHASPIILNSSQRQQCL